MTDTLDTLIAELERAEEGSRELDASIFCAVKFPGHKPERNFFYKNRDEWGVFVSNQPKPGMTFHDAPHYTTSVDAALTLVPEGWLVASISQYAKRGEPRSGVIMIRKEHAARNDMTVPEMNLATPRSEAATAAVALCIAALRVRAVTMAQADA